MRVVIPQEAIIQSRARHDRLRRRHRARPMPRPVEVVYGSGEDAAVTGVSARRAGRRSTGARTCAPARRWSSARAGPARAGVAARRRGHRPPDGRCRRARRGRRRARDRDLSRRRGRSEGDESLRAVHPPAGDDGAAQRCARRRRRDRLPTTSRSPRCRATTRRSSTSRRSCPAPARRRWRPRSRCRWRSSSRPFRGLPDQLESARSARPR